MLAAAAVRSSSTIARDAHAFVPRPNRRILWLVGRLGSLAALLDESEREVIRRSVLPGDVLVFYTCPDASAPGRERVRVEVSDMDSAVTHRAPDGMWRCAGVVRITDDGAELLA